MLSNSSTIGRRLGVDITFSKQLEQHGMVLISSVYVYIVFYKP